MKPKLGFHAPAEVRILPLLCEEGEGEGGGEDSGGGDDPGDSSGDDTGPDSDDYGHDSDAD